MVFSSLVFLIIFMPAVLAGYYLIDRRFKNVFLLIASLLFYAWGDAKSIPILIASILFNYTAALLIDKNKDKKGTAKLIMIFSLVGNIGLLCAFKYLTFVLNNLNKLPGPDITPPGWASPLGISFFTFSAISYVLDVYFQSVSADKNPLNAALYITFFPKMISGPIMKYGDFSKQLNERTVSLQLFTEGVKRFIVGLGKKVLISDIVGVLVDYTFNGDLKTASISVLWVSVVAYMIQLYYDFSGYSDMAIGLGKMFGFEIDENFDYPYISKSVVEYWARWHITLGTWVKHYIYTPVFRAISKKKGKDGKKLNMKYCDYIALFVSWLIIGPWHGAGYKFIVYGMYYFFFILLERINDNRKKKRAKAGNPVKTYYFTEHILPHIYMFFVLMLGQMLVRANSLTDAFVYLKCMIGLGGNPLTTVDDIYIMRQYVIVLIVGLIFSMPVIPFVKTKLCKSNASIAVYDIAEKLICLGIMIVSLAAAVGSTYNAFIYFNF